MSTNPSILSFFTSFIKGLRLIDGGQLEQMAELLFAAKSGITAAAGGTQALGTALVSALNEIDTCASDSDSVVLPLALPGRQVTIYNATAHTLAVFGSASNPQNAGAGDTIAAHNSATQQPTATGVTQATLLTATYQCFVLGQWKQLLSA